MDAVAVARVFLELYVGQLVEPLPVAVGGGVTVDGEDGDVDARYEGVDVGLKLPRRGVEHLLPVAEDHILIDPVSGADQRLRRLRDEVEPERVLDQRPGVGKPWPAQHRRRPLYQFGK